MYLCTIWIGNVANASDPVATPATSPPTLDRCAFPTGDASLQTCNGQPRPPLDTSESAGANSYHRGEGIIFW